MDLKIYYQKIRQIEAKLTEEHVVVVSHETHGGGRAGVLTEVPRLVAAKMMIEGLVRLASSDEAREFREGLAEAKRAVEQAAAASRLQVSVISDADLKALKGVPRPKGQ